MQRFIMLLSTLRPDGLLPAPAGFVDGAQPDAQNNGGFSPQHIFA